MLLPFLFLQNLLNQLTSSLDFQKDTCFFFFYCINDQPLQICFLVQLDIHFAQSYKNVLFRSIIGQHILQQLYQNVGMSIQVLLFVLSNHITIQLNESLFVQHILSRIVLNQFDHFLLCILRILNEIDDVVYFDGV